MGTSERWHSPGDIVPESLLAGNCSNLWLSVKSSPQTHNLHSQGSLLAVLSPALPVSASTAQKDLRNLHLPPWLQHRLPKPSHLRKCSPAPRPGAPGWGQQQLPVLLCSGTSPQFGDSTHKSPGPSSPMATVPWHSSGALRGAQSQLLHPPRLCSHLSLLLGWQRALSAPAASTLCSSLPSLLSSSSFPPLCLSLSLSPG